MLHADIVSSTAAGYTPAPEFVVMDWGLGTPKGYGYVYVTTATQRFHGEHNVVNLVTSLCHCGKNIVLRIRQVKTSIASRRCSKIVFVNGGGSCHIYF
jgi:hypothetical protein